MKTLATNKKLRELIAGIDSESLIPRPDFQRRLIWTNKDKVAFIETVLKNDPFPEIYVAAGDIDENTGKATEFLVDGQQRTTTLYHYFKGHDSIKLPSGIKKYSELNPDEKKNFLQYDVVVRDLGNLDINEIKRIFQKINATGYPLNAMEIDNSRFAGEFKTFGEIVAEKDFFKKRNIFSSNDIRRMKDVRYSLTLISTMMSGYFNEYSKIEEFLENYNDVFDKRDEVEKRIDSAFKFIEACQFEDGSRVWNKGDLFTLIIELDKMYFSKKRKADVKVISGSLKAFYSKLEGTIVLETLAPNTATYYKAAIQGNNSRSRRIARGKVLRKLIA